MADNPVNEVELTEDGHPVGQLVFTSAESPAVALDPGDNAVEATRKELLAENAKALTGNPDADAAVAELYPEYGNSDKRRMAMKLYITEMKEIDEVATAVGVPGRTVAMWIYEGQWDELVKKEVAAYNARSVLELAKLRAKKRADITKAQLEQAEKIRDRAMERIDNDEGSLKSNTESWAAAAKIEHTLTGVSEAGAIASIDGEQERKKETEGKQPLVMVFQGGLPPMRKNI